jgi:hypothetical protein
LVILLVAIHGGIVMLKAIDWLAHRGPEISPARARWFLTVLPGLEVDDIGTLVDGRERFEIAGRRLLAAVAGLMSGLALAALGQRLALPGRSFPLDCGFKTVEIYLLAGGLNHLLVAAFAFAGYRLRDAFRYPILARSVLDFWSRYDVWIHRWLKRNVFVPVVRRGRKPAVAVLAVFTTSGLLHEYLFAPVTSELLGWQFAFFGLHGLGAITGSWLGDGYRAIAGRRVPRPIAVIATLVFVFASAPVFIHCVDRVLDLHRGVGALVLRMVG